MKQSNVIRKLTVEEIYTLKQELSLNDNLWLPHSPNLNLTALKDGKSIHIQWYDDNLNLVSSNWDKFPKTKLLLDSFNAGNKLGRVYWHRLLPNEIIQPHNDSLIPFVSSGQLLFRYQIYLDIDQSIVIYIDGKKIDNLNIENSLIDFELRNIHYYKNSSNTSFYLLVFDIVS